MSKTKSFSEIVNSMIERLKVSQPNLDTKIGSVSRDVFIDIQADEMQKLYALISAISEKQSFATASGRDLDLIARNFGISRNSGSLSSGLILFTTSNLTTEVSIPEGTEVSTRSGISFRTIGSFVMTPSQKNIYSGNATRVRATLNRAGISDQYAIEVPIQAVTRGTASNVSSFQINQNGGPLELNAINSQATSGGANSESDSTFRARIFSLFNGSNTGTSIGYKNAALGTSGVTDALVVEPGSSLMLRDGSEVISSDDGSLSVVNSGTGGKVDIYVLGSNLIQATESFVFRDKSSDENISDDKNDIILGYSGIDLNKTNLQRRMEAYKSGAFPLQPANSIISVQGSLSGVFVEDGSDNANYRLEKDLNPDTGGSPFGQDKIKFISNRKFVSAEQVTKSKTASGDNIKFFGSPSINSVYQNIFISSEKATVDSNDKSIIKLRNKHIVSIDSIRNENTGEQYSYQEYNIEEEYDSFAAIKISGSKLPTKGEVVSVSYTFSIFFDKNVNFQSDTNYYLSNKDISDKIYWGSNDYLEREASFVSRNSDNSNFIIDSSENVEDVISVYSYSSEQDLVVEEDDIGKFVDVQSQLKNIISARRSDGLDFSVGSKDLFIMKNMRLYIPPKSNVALGELIDVDFNRVDFFNLESGEGSFYENKIVLPSDKALEDEGLLLKIQSISNSFSNIFIDYISKKGNLVSNIELSSMPILGSPQNNLLFRSSGSVVESSYQPTEYEYEFGSISSIKRFSPSSLKMTVESPFASGLIRFSGTTLSKIIAEVPGSFFDGSTFDLSSVIKSFAGTNFVPSTMRVCKISNLKLDGSNLDVIGYKINDNIYDDKIAINDASIPTYGFGIADTDKNNSISFSSGSLFEVEVYIEDQGDSEDVEFIESGDKYTGKIYSRIDSIDIISGFRDNQGVLSGSISISRVDKPEENSSYFCDYDFKSPIDGERITVNYTMNRLVIDATKSIESVRAVTSDVLVKEAEAINIDCSTLIVVSDELTESKDLVAENVQNQITNTINVTQLGGSISVSSIISSGSTIAGVEAISVNKFCESGNEEKLSFIKALDNQTIVPGTIDVKVVSRRNFL